MNMFIQKCDNIMCICVVTNKGILSLLFYRNLSVLSQFYLCPFLNNMFF